MKVHPNSKVHANSGVDSSLAAIATLTAAWPISTLLAEPAWLRGVLVLLGVIALSGFGARSMALRAWQVLVVQLGFAILAVGAIYGQGHLWHGLPTLSTLRYADGLIRESVVTAQRYTAPAPTTPGLMFVVGCALGLVALTVDYLAVTCRSPSLAGLPLLTVFLAVAANRGSTLPVIFFLTVATMWLIMVARADATILRRWSTTAPVASTPVPQNRPATGVNEHASMARMAGAVALVAAVAVPVALPHPSSTFLVSGLGRSLSGNGNGAQVVGFSQSVDLAQDLRSRSRAPVLQYTTDDTAPPPLRVAVGSAYLPEQGVWLPWGRPWHSSAGSADLSTNPKVPEPAGLAPQVPRRTFAMHVRGNLLEDPFLAAPYPLVGADMAGVAWVSDYETQSIRVAQRPDAYTVFYLQLNPSTTMLGGAPSLNERDRHLFDLDLRLDGPYAGRVSTLTRQLTAGMDSSYNKAMAIQQYLRADGGFTYSLTLAPPAKDRFGRNAGYDALTNFLVTKQGYCVQFATAMVMMSRAAGIPARIDLGFLPGTQTKGVWTVIAADAHAWPELYLDGVGWTRFEPTPSRAAPPAYAIPGTSPRSTAASGPSSTATTPAQPRTTHKDLGVPPTSDGAPAKTGLSADSALSWLTHGWGLVLLAVLTGLLGPLLVPMAAVWGRRRNLRKANTAAGRVEVEWEHLISTMGDLGITPEPSHTPRQLGAYYNRQALLEGPASRALSRVVQTVERSRYAVSSAHQQESFSADVREVLRAAAATRTTRNRLRAALWPSGGIAQLRSVRVHFAQLFRTPLRDVSNLLPIRQDPGRRSLPSVSLKDH